MRGFAVAVAVMALLAMAAGTGVRGDVSTPDTSPVPALLWEYQIAGNSHAIAVSPNGTYAAMHNGTHLHLYDRGGLLWSVECSGGYDVRVDDRGRTYVLGGDIALRMYDVNGNLLRGYSPPAYGAIVTAMDVSRDGKYVAVAWSSGDARGVDFLRTDDQGSEWLPYANFTIDEDIMVDGVKISWNNDKVLVYGWYVDSMIYLVDLYGNELWNTSAVYGYVDMDPYGYHILWGNDTTMHLIENGTEKYTITTDELVGENATETIYYAVLTHRYIAISSPRINIIDFKRDPYTIAWSKIGSWGDREDLISAAGDYMVTCEDYILHFWKISTGEEMWREFPSPGVEDMKLSEYGTFILYWFYNDTGHYMRYIASRPDIALSFEPYIAGDGTVYVCEDTKFYLSYSYVAPSARAYWRVDAGDYTEYSTYFYIADYDEGFHTVEYYCVDYYGLESGVKARAVYLDKSPPALDILAPLNGSLVPQTFQLRVNCSDSGVGVATMEYSVDGGSWMPIQSVSVQIGPLPDGMHTIRVRASDLFTHTSVSYISVIVDSTPPTLWIVEPENSTQVGERFTLVWNATDSVGIHHYEVRVDSGSWVDVGVNTSYGLHLQPGEHTLYVRAVDTAGNVAVAWVKVRVMAPFPWIPVAAAVMVIAVALSAFFLYRRRSNPVERETVEMEGENAR